MKEYMYNVIIDGVKQRRSLNQADVKKLMQGYHVSAYCSANEYRTGFLYLLSNTGKE